MRYLKSRQSGTDKTVHEFVFGTEELQLLYSLVIKAKQHTPRVVDTIHVLGRLNNLQRVMFEAMKINKIRNNHGQ